MVRLLAGTVAALVAWPVVIIHFLALAQFVLVGG
jgi:hypothetical protein